MSLEARIVPRRVVPALVASVVLLVVGVGSALAGVGMGWVLAAFMVWTTVGLGRRMRRREPVLTIDDAGVRDHRVPVAVGWDEVERVRTVNRRVVVAKVPLLELVPRGRFAREGRAVARAVLRGDLAFADARDDTRVMIDLRHLDATPEEVLAAVREHRPAPR